MKKFIKSKIEDGKFYKKTGLKPLTRKQNNKLNILIEIGVK